MFYMKKLSYKKIFLHDCWCTHHGSSITIVFLYPPCPLSVSLSSTVYPPIICYPLTTTNPLSTHLYCLSIHYLSFSHPLTIIHPPTHLPSIHPLVIYNYLPTHHLSIHFPLSTHPSSFVFLPFSF